MWKDSSANLNVQLL